MKRKVTTLVGMVVLFIVAMAAGHATAAENMLTIEGSTTVGPIADAFADAMKKKYPDLKVNIAKPGSGFGEMALIEGRCDIAMLSRFMKGEKFEEAAEKGIMPTAHAVAMDGVCVVVHPANPVEELSREQIRKIYAGEITNWKDVGGVDMEIVVVTRDTSSGTYDTFNHFVMNKQKISGSAETVATNPQAFASVKDTEGAIGYVGFGFLKPEVKTVKVDGILPTKQTILSGKFPISRPLFMFTNGYPAIGSLTHEFVTFYLTEEGQDLVETQGFVPMTQY